MSAKRNQRGVQAQPCLGGWESNCHLTTWRPSPPRLLTSRAQWTACFGSFLYPCSTTALESLSILCSLSVGSQCSVPRRNKTKSRLSKSLFDPMELGWSFKPSSLLVEQCVEQTFAKRHKGLQFCDPESGRIACSHKNGILQKNKCSTCELSAV